MRNRKVKILILIIFVLVSGLFLVWQKKRIFDIKSDQPINNQEQKEGSLLVNSDLKSPISGLVCANAKRRPIAVMLSGDAVARPLSGISQADLIFEMPVTEGSITRFMAVFVCNDPKEIGSVRSARHDFIPLALGLDAIYIHWGGSHFALDKLKASIIDNLDALPNLFNTFYRKSDIPAPHNGFTSMRRILLAAEKLNYRLTGRLVGYNHLSDAEIEKHNQERRILRVEYPGAFRVGYEYNPETNSYLRFRGGVKETDKNIDQQIEAKNVVIMRAESRSLEGDYNDVQVEGEGKAEFYLNGEKFSGSWEKDKNNSASKLFFYDDKSKEIRFVPGQIWVEIVEPERSVTWN